MPDARIAVLGDASVDYVIELPDLPSADEKVTPLATRRMLGGTGANAAVAMHSLGSAVTLHAVVGDDPDGAWVLSELRRRGLETTNIEERRGTTAFATILLRGPHREVIVDIGVGLDLTPVALAEVAAADLAYVTYAPAAVIELVAAGLGPMTVAGFEGWMVDDHQFRRVLDQCFLLITNRVGWEALVACGDLPKATTIQTLGSDGVALHHPDGTTVQFSSYEVEAVDATGAGDCFAGTLCHYVANGHTMDDSIRRAAIAAALSTTVVGGQGWAPTESEIASRLPSHALDEVTPS